MHRCVFWTKLNIYDGAFFTSAKPYFEIILNSAEFPLGSIFYTIQHFVKIFGTVKNFGKESIFRRTFFQNLKLFNGRCAITKKWIMKVFKIASVKIAKIACVCIVFFFNHF